MPPPPGAHGVMVTSMVPVVSSILVDDEPIGVEGAEVDRRHALQVLALRVVDAHRIGAVGVVRIAHVRLAAGEAGAVGIFAVDEAVVVVVDAVVADLGAEHVAARIADALGQLAVVRVGARIVRPCRPCRRCGGQLRPTQAMSPPRPMSRSTTPPLPSRLERPQPAMARTNNAARQRMRESYHTAVLTFVISSKCSRRVSPPAWR